MKYANASVTYVFSANVVGKRYQTIPNICFQIVQIFTKYTGLQQRKRSVYKIVEEKCTSGLQQLQVDRMNAGPLHQKLVRGINVHLHSVNLEGLVPGS